MAGAGGFWSYVHADDDGDGGRIVRLHHDVVAQYEMITGESIDLFLDRDAIEWGTRWRGRVDDSLASGAFFIAVVTPRYFRSSECRRELQSFARQARALGVTELVMPLLYLDFADLHVDPPTDDLVALIKDFHWVDWKELRFADPTSSEYRRGVAGLADRLVRASTEVQSIDVASAAENLERSGDDDDSTDGFLDRMAKAEEAMPQWAATLQEIGELITEIAGMVDVSTANLNQAGSQGKGFAARLTVARKLATSLQGPADRIKILGSDFTTQLHAVDSGIRVIIERAPAELADDPSGTQQVCEFFDTMRNLSIAAHESLGHLSGMIDAITPGEKISKDLRPALRVMRQGLTLMFEGRAITDEWLRLIESSPVNCSSADQSMSVDVRDPQIPVE